MIKKFVLILVLIAFLMACAGQIVGKDVYSNECCVEGSVEIAIPFSSYEEELKPFVAKFITINENIMFDWDKSFIRFDQIKVVNEIARLMKEYPETKITIKGYASIEGEIDYNLNLSNRRVEAVKDALVSMGVSVERIVNAQAKGETDIFGIELSKNRKVSVFTVE